MVRYPSHRRKDDYNRYNKGYLTCDDREFRVNSALRSSVMLFMSMLTLEGIVENGQIRLPDNIQLPEQTKVYVVIPALTAEPLTPQLKSPRLVHREQAKDFQKIVIHNAIL